MKKLIGLIVAVVIGIIAFKLLKAVLTGILGIIIPVIMCVAAFFLIMLLFKVAFRK